MANNKFDKVAIGDIGTQLFHFDSSAFKYAFPITAGAEFGGDSESFEAPETDLDYIPKVMGRKSLNDIQYTVNYTAERYKAIRGVIGDSTKVNTYMEVFSDDSAMIFKGTANEPTITAGDVRQMTLTIIPSYMKWVSNIHELDTEDLKTLESGWYTGTAINIDKTSIPDARTGHADTKNSEE